MLCLVAALWIAERSSGEEIDFDRQILPILESRCTECHGFDEEEGGLRLDDAAGVLRGGTSGEPTLVPGRSHESRLYRVLVGLDDELEMPPSGPPLTEDQIKLIKDWIDSGAPLPIDADELHDPFADHWSYQPLDWPTVPAAPRDRIHNPVDAFVWQKLHEAGLEPAPQAERRTLIRRLYLVMLGVPPSPAEVTAFLNDERPNAYERLVDRVLASPHYGERWARHWLDLVRFGETDGFETNRERPTAYHYRDYVIAAFNDDRPYDQFVQDQIAGDVSGNPLGTGFLVAGPHDIVKSPDLNLTRMQRQDELADLVHTTGTAFLGLTLGCARCHDHKFDPIRQRDFYAVQAVFAGVTHGQRPLPIDRTGRGASDHLREPVQATLNQEVFEPMIATAIRFTIRATSNGSEPCLDELEVFAEGVNVAVASQGGRASASSTLPGYEIHKLEHINDGLYGNSRSWISNQRGAGWVQIDFDRAYEIHRILWGRDRQGQYADRLPTDYVIELCDPEGQWHRVADSTDRRPRVDQPDRLGYLGQFVSPDPVYRLYRGDPSAPRERIAPNAIDYFGAMDLEADAPESARRRALAQWITADDNPLAARVMVNRLWQQVFGRGLADTPSDFGGNGVSPSHPELLDWLACQLMDRASDSLSDQATQPTALAWSLKRVHRILLTSATFRQSSTPRADAMRLDAQTRLWWRFPPRRLEAEAIRDSLLAAAGTLDRRLHGPGFSGFRVQLENVRHYFPKEDYGPSDWRRMVYMTKVRQEQDSVFGAFDCPDASQVQPQRSRSTTPIQALNLFNSRFSLQQSALMAVRLQRLADQRLPASVAASERIGRQVDWAFLIAYSRQPTDEEKRDAQSFVTQHGLDAFCRALINSNEFLFIP